MVYINYKLLYWVMTILYHEETIESLDPSRSIVSKNVWSTTISQSITGSTCQEPPSETKFAQKKGREQETSRPLLGGAFWKLVTGG